ncbi:hypothetical protein T07_9781 [Trichinella nelsoni]|uniref:Uncharacterized protein n=1 Tax=Trichinella nelsoni TaxID=6336 RepID=A0A0V0S6P2_9BILA|nr:hypothetical protein T07_9781 [Trichinella nelsoni]
MYSSGNVASSAYALRNTQYADSLKKNIHRKHNDFKQKTHTVLSFSGYMRSLWSRMVAFLFGIQRISGYMFCNSSYYFTVQN